MCIIVVRYLWCFNRFSAVSLVNRVSFVSAEERNSAFLLSGKTIVSAINLVFSIFKWVIREMNVNSKVEDG